MPEVPEVELYLHALRARVLNQPLERVRIVSVSLLKTVDPPVAGVEGKRVIGVRRLGQRIVFDLDDDLHIVIHLMVAGRFQWKARGAALSRKLAHAAFDFPNGTLLLTEAGTKKRASMHVVRGEAARTNGAASPMGTAEHASNTPNVARGNGHWGIEGS